MEKYSPERLQYILPSGGYNFWLTMPPGYSADELAWRLNDHAIAIVPGSVFYHTQIKSSSFRLSLAGIDEDGIDEGIKLLMTIIKEWYGTKQGTNSGLNKPVL